jgi:hypothetical protein
MNTYKTGSYAFATFMDDELQEVCNEFQGSEEVAADELYLKFGAGVTLPFTEGTEKEIRKASRKIMEDKLLAAGFKK